MFPVYSLEKAAEKDHELIARYHLDESILIDNAAQGVFQAVSSFIHGRILVMAGPGNNGSDGLALVSILLDHGYKPDLFLLYEKGNEENLKRRKTLPSGIRIVSDTSGYDTVFDALFGFSFHGTADGRTLKALQDARSAATVIAVDVPSAGAIAADYTVSLMCWKDVLFEPLSRGRNGKLFFYNPGFPENELISSPYDIYLLAEDDLSLPEMKISDYKNTRGHLAVLGGSERYTGAPRLTARSAFFSGAGLVSIITDSDRIRDENPAVIITPPSSADLSSYGSLVVGPGWDSGDSGLFRKAVESGKNLVIDADALRFVPGYKLGGRAVLTPHVGEYRKLAAALGVPDGLGNADALAASLKRISMETESIIVLKASSVWITDGRRIRIYDGANPSLGVAGSGDVLSGVTGALLLSGLSPFDAAVNAVILHQKAGRKAHEEYGYYSAEELILSVGRCR